MFFISFDHFLRQDISVLCVFIQQKVEVQQVEVGAKGTYNSILLFSQLKDLYKEHTKKMRLEESSRICLDTEIRKFIQLFSFCQFLCILKETVRSIFVALDILHTIDISRMSTKVSLFIQVAALQNFIINKNLVCINMYMCYLATSP